MMGPLVHISFETGHHLSYQNLFVRILNGTASTGPIRSLRFRDLMRAPNVFFCTIDSDYVGFFAIAIYRALRRRPTTGLFLRPTQCFSSNRSIKYTLKRWSFRFLRRLPGLKLLSILPFELEPRLALICHDWIYDPQLWDLWLDGPPKLPVTDLSKRVRSEAGTRQILIFVGSGTRIKGFPEFVAFAEKRRASTLAVVAGRVSDEFRDGSKRLQRLGMIVEDRFVSDDEILSLYKIADHAWCRYAPDYDQASGVFGRALQTGVSPIIRDGSMLHRMQTQFGSLDAKFFVGLCAQATQLICGDVTHSGKRK